MVKLLQNRVYTNNISDLGIRILKIYHENDRYYKVRGFLFNKSNGIIYEQKQYKLLKKRINNWHEVR